MKTQRLLFIALLIIGLAGFENAFSGVVVRVKPVAPKVVVVKTKKPGNNHVWINGHWKWNKRYQKYTWVEGHWAKTPGNKVWIVGYWKNVPGGWIWIPGHWK